MESTITYFDADEEIIEILGSINHFPVISSLCIVTNKRRHGPFGPETGNSFSVSWDVGTFAGFYGRAGAFLDGLGFYSNKQESAKSAYSKYRAKDSLIWCIYRLW
ncbi:putative jacalin-like lectin domain-containing protein [Helianthus annuus]|nr:putative jacalin-like lectin domain-containing protein [Helianthus annuus]